MSRIVMLTDEQLALVILSLRDQATFCTHAAESEEKQGFGCFAQLDRERAARLNALAEQLELTHPDVKVA